MQLQRLALGLMFLLAACLASVEVFGRTPSSSKLPQECAVKPQSSAVVNVRSKGAKGDGKTDDTAAIQAAIDAVPKGGTVLIPAGTYLVNGRVDSRIRLRGHMTLRLADGATLKEMPVDTSNYALLTVARAKDVNVVGGTLEGERDAHTGDDGQDGMGIRIDHGAENVTISGVIAKNLWADGFYIQDANNVRLCAVTADNNRRQGLSIIQAESVLIVDSIFQNTHGVRPGAGIDLEPDKRAESISGIRIEKSKFTGNQGPGIEVNAKKGPTSGVEIAKNVFDEAKPILLRGGDHAIVTVCQNRYLTYLAKPSDGLNAFADQVKTSVAEDDDASVIQSDLAGSCGRRTAKQ